MITDKLKNNKGFALLFAVTISAMLLAIALGVSNIALKEINFSTSARNTNDAFFAADTGVECLLTNDKSATSVFTSNSPSSFNINCVNSSIPVVKSGSAPNYAWDFTVLNLGSAGGSCAKVRVTKDFTDIYDVVTVVSSRGYNMGDSACNSTSSSRVEREIEVVYGGTGVPSAPEDPPPPPPPPPSSSILTISKAGTGTGTVTSSIPAGTINCGADCAETYTDGTAVTLTASPAVGSTFAGWSGGGCSGTANCSLTINSNQTITATFNTTNAVPTVTTPTVSSITSSGATLGANVTSLGTPASISARGTCWGTSPAPTSNCIAQGGTTTGAFTHARTGMSANTLYYYRGYATNTSGTGYSVDGTFTTSAGVTQYTLTVSKNGTGLGSVSSSPPGITCGADCTENYNDGTPVTLGATNSPGSTFAGWSGACTGTDPACFVTMSAARNVTATFNLDSAIVATGGTVTTLNGYKYHAFTTTGTSTFQVTSGSGNVEVLVVGGGAGGGTGGTASRGGGGAGGVVYNASFPVSVGSYSVTVGAGSAAPSSGAQSANGGNSVFSSLTALGGGGAGMSAVAGKNGGSGGGGSGWSSVAGGIGLQPSSASGGYGNNGGAAMSGTTGGSSGGGGGAGGAGVNGVAGQGGNGGTGMQFSQFSSVGGSPAGWFGGGGGGGAAAGGLGGTGGQGGGGAGKSSGVGTAGVNGTGGGGGGSVSTGGRGGNGIVIVRYPSP